MVPRVVPQAQQDVTRRPRGASELGVHPDQRMALRADAYSANGALRPTTDLPAIGARTNSRTAGTRCRQSVQVQGLVPGPPAVNHVGKRRTVPSVGVGLAGGPPAIDAGRLRRHSANGAFRLFPYVLTNGAGANRRLPRRLNSLKSFGLKPLRQDQMTAIMPASGGPRVQGRACEKRRPTGNWRLPPK